MVSIKQNYCIVQVIISSLNYDVTRGELYSKASTYIELIVSRFLKNQPKIKKSSTNKYLESSLEASSDLNQRLNVSDLQNQSMTNRQDDYTLVSFTLSDT